MTDTTNLALSSEAAGRATLPSLRLLTFTVADRLLALPVDDVIELVPMPALSSRFRPGFVLVGFLNLDGAALPVLNTARLLDEPDAGVGLHTPLIIVRDRAGRFALLVERVHQIETVRRDAVFALAPGAPAASAVNLAERIVPIVSTEALILTEERERIEQLRESHQRRLEELREVCA